MQFQNVEGSKSFKGDNVEPLITKIYITVVP